MLSQYAELCAAHEDALVLFQVGDFYEAFCEAAEAVARVCEVTLTERSDSTGDYPMAGIPIDNAASYLESLLDAGYRVAIGDQVEDAEAASGLVDRAVTEVITPGTVVEDDLLESGTTNYVAAVTRETAGSTDADRDAEPRVEERLEVGRGVVDGDPGHRVVTGRVRALRERHLADPRDGLGGLAERLVEVADLKQHQGVLVGGTEVGVLREHRRELLAGGRDPGRQPRGRLSVRRFHTPYPGGRGHKRCGATRPSGPEWSAPPGCGESLTVLRPRIRP